MTSYDVAVCCYNEKHTIMACMESVKTYCHHDKLIVVDDGSDDGTSQIAEEYADIFLTSGKHSIGVSRQLAVENTDQDYLLFVDADVELTRCPDPMLELFQNSKIKVVRGLARNVIRQRFTGKHGKFVGMGLTFIDVPVAKKIKFPPYSVAEDSHYCFRVTDAGYWAQQDARHIYGVHYQSKYLDIPKNLQPVVSAMVDGDSDLFLTLQSTIEQVAEALPHARVFYLRDKLEKLARETRQDEWNSVDWIRPEIEWINILNVLDKFVDQE